MYLDEHIDIVQMEIAVREGLLSRRFHPTWPLAILNYTKEAMGKTHDNPTLRRCRGLIYDIKTMKIVARPMEAFFNVNDERYPETSIDRLMTWFHSSVSHQDVQIEITDKMDGSMGIIYQYEDNPPEVATRGSFESEQAKWATEYLQRNCPVLTQRGVGPATIIVEIIYPGNQIVVDYGAKADLTLLAMIDTPTGQEIDHKMLTALGKLLNLTVVPRFRKTPAQCTTENERNREGYVLKFTLSGEPVPRRFKAKFEDYRLAHRAMFGMNDRDVWEMWKNSNYIIDLRPFATATPGFNTWLQERIAALDYAFHANMRTVEKIVAEVNDGLGTGMKEATPLRKYVAEYFKVRAGDLFSACFACYDGKDYAKVIVKGLRPTRARTYKEPRPEAE